MAKILLGANITSMTGKLGGTVFQGIGKGQTIMRRKVSPNRHPIRQYTEVGGQVVLGGQFNKSLFASLSQSWRGLTEAQRNGWRRQHQAGLSGFALFKRYNAGMIFGLVPYTTYPGAPPEMGVILTASVQDVAGPPYRYFIRYSVERVPNNQKFILYVGSTGSVGRQSPTSGYRVARIVNLVPGDHVFTFEPEDIGLVNRPGYAFAYRLMSQTPSWIDQLIPISKRLGLDDSI